MQTVPRDLLRRLCGGSSKVLETRRRVEKQQKYTAGIDCVKDSETLRGARSYEWLVTEKLPTRASLVVTLDSLTEAEASSSRKALIRVNWS